VILFRSLSIGIFLFILIGCSSSPPISHEDTSPRTITHVFGQDSLHLTFTGGEKYFRESFNQDSLFYEPVQKLIDPLLSDIKDSSLRHFIKTELISKYTDWFELTNVSINHYNITLDYIIKYDSINRSISNALKAHKKNIAFPIEPSFPHNDKFPSVNDFNDAQFHLPCDSISVPENPLFLPNSPRNYRNGIHRGIDFQANWGTPVRAVANGMIVRSDLYYKEISSSFLEKGIDHSERTGHTPSDLFNHIFLGRAVIIDHGFEIVRGYRTISIYAHLSEILPHIIPGYEITKGEVFGKVGNSGMVGAINGNKKGSHLHIEIIVQNESGEYYLGQGVESSQLFDLLNKIYIK